MLTNRGVASFSADIGRGLWVQFDLMVLPIGVGSGGSGLPIGDLTLGTRTLAENLLQVGGGMAYHF